jgi:hypothetical protein
MDDAVIIIIRKDFFETHAKLDDIMNCAGGIFEWARDHNCEFGIKKFQLLDITGRLAPNPVTQGKEYQFWGEPWFSGTNVYHPRTQQDSWEW